MAQQEAKRKAKAIYKRGRKIEQERKAEKQRIDKQTPCPFFKKHGTCNYVSYHIINVVQLMSVRDRSSTCFIFITGVHKNSFICSG